MSIADLGIIMVAYFWLPGSGHSLAAAIRSILDAGYSMLEENGSKQ